jgi:hypothetical protein
MQNEDLYDLYFSLNDLKAINTRMRSERGCGIMGGGPECRVSVGKPAVNIHSKYLEEDARRVLKWISDKLVGRAWSGVIWLKTGKNGGLF